MIVQPRRKLSHKSYKVSKKRVTARRFVRLKFNAGVTIIGVSDAIGRRVWCSDGLPKSLTEYVPLAQAASYKAHQIERSQKHAQ